MAELFERHSRMVYALCRVHLRDTAEADDATQQTFLSAYRSMLRGSEPRNPASWLATIARHECVKRARARAGQPLPLAEIELAGDDDLTDVAQRREEIDALRVAVRDLPREQREAFILREFYGLSYREIALTMNRSAAAVETMLFRSRRRLQAQLGPARAAITVFVVPSVVRDFLSNSVPGFWGSTTAGSAVSGAGAGGALLGKLGSTPLAAKIAAALLVVGTAGTMTAVERKHRPPGLHRSVIRSARPPATPKAPAVRERVRTRHTTAPAPSTPAPRRQAAPKPAAKQAPRSHAPSAAEAEAAPTAPAARVGETAPVQSRQALRDAGDSTQVVEAAPPAPPTVPVAGADPVLPAGTDATAAPPPAPPSSDWHEASSGDQAGSPSSTETSTVAGPETDY